MNFLMNPTQAWSSEIRGKTRDRRAVTAFCAIAESSVTYQRAWAMAQLQ
jgi:hypothetical protein